jgi:hypothetical protein
LEESNFLWLGYGFLKKIIGGAERENGSESLLYEKHKSKKANMLSVKR